VNDIMKRSKRGKGMRKAVVMASAVVMAMAVSADMPQIVAHRGGSKEQDQNTLAALQNSCAKGVRGFEIDVRLTKDRRIVLMHDDMIERLTTGQGRVEDLTSAELARIRTRKSNQPLPYLEEVFDFLKDKEGAFVQVEIKSGKYSEADLAEMCGLLLGMVKRQIDPAKVIFISFDKRALRKIKELEPKQQTCLVTSEANPHVIQTAQAVGAGQLSVELNHLYRAFVRDAHKAGLKVTAWTVGQAEDAQLAIAMGTDYVATDIPAAQLDQKSARP